MKPTHFSRKAAAKKGHGAGEEAHRAGGGAHSLHLDVVDHVGHVERIPRIGVHGQEVVEDVQHEGAHKEVRPGAARHHSAPR